MDFTLLTEQVFSGMTSFLEFLADLNGLSVTGRFELFLPVLFRIISILQWLVTHIILILYEIDPDHPCRLDYTRKSTKSLIQFLKCLKVSHLYIGSVQQLSIFIKMEWKLKFQKLGNSNLPFIVSRIGLFSPHAGTLITTYASLRQRKTFRCHISQFKWVNQLRYWDF